MMARVNDSSSKSFFQSDRYFTTNNEWYFATRETSGHGPFNTQQEAANELNVYLKTEIGIKDFGTDIWDSPGLLR